ncbi:hypothetical protein L9Z73_10040 [Pseudomonas sp. TNT11]|uniref:Uncharacterized protein n=1 Tax=Pseudomonas emilianonis TaxID=2915812 RepID=A0ABT0EG31_9PSED|nr:hypothetical protein [Pseudomonas emilianonis]MCK1784682.1 hypothetical protein [Pseudomonas emilianonis]
MSTNFTTWALSNNVAAVDGANYTAGFLICKPLIQKNKSGFALKIKGLKRKNPLSRVFGRLKGEP